MMDVEGILREVLDKGMVIGRDPEGHGWQLLGFDPDALVLQGPGSLEVICQHEDWGIFLGLCEERL